MPPVLIRTPPAAGGARRIGSARKGGGGGPGTAEASLTPRTSSVHTAVVVRDPLGWTDLNVEQLKALEPDDFEKLCFDLIQFEAYDRHHDPGIEGQGRTLPPDS